MSGQPNICIDIFSQMADLIASFNNNLSTANGDTFSHEAGFTSSTDPLSAGDTPGGNGGFEDRINEYV